MCFVWLLFSHQLGGISFRLVGCNFLWVTEKGVMFRFVSFLYGTVVFDTCNHAYVYRPGTIGRYYKGGQRGCTYARSRALVFFLGVYGVVLRVIPSDGCVPSIYALQRDQTSLDNLEYKG